MLARDRRLTLLAVDLAGKAAVAPIDDEDERRAAVERDLKRRVRDGLRTRRGAPDERVDDKLEAPHSGRVVATDLAPPDGRRHGHGHARREAVSIAVKLGQRRFEQPTELGIAPAAVAEAGVVWGRVRTDEAGRDRGGEKDIGQGVDRYVDVQLIDDSDPHQPDFRADAEIGNRAAGKQAAAIEGHAGLDTGGEGSPGSGALGGRGRPREEQEQDGG